MIRWHERGIHPPTVDPDGSVDLGNIDSLRFEGQRYDVNGSWGSVTLVAATRPHIVSSDEP